MAKTIKGLKVEIGGDTTKLREALNSINATSRSLKTELNFVNKALKLDPGNVELTKQKQQLLNEAISATKDKLNAMKQAQAEAQRLMSEGTAVNQKEYRLLQREISFAENELRGYEAQLAAMGTNLEAVGDKISGFGNKVTGAGRAMMPVTAAIVGLGTAAVKTAADFDEAMSKVGSVSGAVGDELDELRDKAREMGASTKFSATEAAEAMNYMAMAGWKTGDMLDGIEGIMNLAAASGEELATTSDIVTDALTAFGLTAADAGHFADVLAAASSSANTNVSMMGETFKYCAPIAGSLGFSVEDTAQAIGLMANAGIKSSQAGTSLRAIMTTLSGEAKICTESFGELTVRTSNTDGSMRDLSDILRDCRVIFRDLSESEKAAAAEALVGTNAMSGFLALMNAGKGDIDKLSMSIENCDGKSSEMAETMQDNLTGQLTILKSQLQELAISFGELLMPVIRDIVTRIQQFVDRLNSMSDAKKKLVVQIAAVVAAIGPALMIVGKLISAGGVLVKGIGRAQKAFGALQAALLANSSIGGVLTQAIGKATGSIQGMGSAISSAIAPLLKMAAPVLPVVAAVAAAVGVLVAAFKHLWETNEEFRTKMIEIWEGIKAKVNGFVQGVRERLEEIGIDFETVITAVQMIWDGFCQLLVPVFEGVWAQIANALGAVLDVLLGVLDVFIGLFTGNWEQCFKGVQEIFHAVGQFLVTTLQNMGDMLMGLLDVICGFFGTTWEETWSGIEQFFTDTWSNITGFFQDIAGSIVTSWKDGWNNIVQFFEEGIPQFIEDVVHWLDELPRKVGFLLGTLIGNVVKFGCDMAGWIDKNVPEFVNSVVTYIASLPDRIKKWLDDAIEKVKSWKEDMKKRAKETARGFVDGIVDYLKELPGKVKKWLDSTIVKLVEWKNDMAEKGREGIGEFIDNIVEGARSIPDKMKEIGKAIVDGVWQGIKNAKNDFLRKIEDFFKGIVDGVKSALGIASPSKVMAREVGQWIPKGVAAGIEDAGGAVDDAMSGMFSDISRKSKTAFRLMTDADNAALASLNFHRGNTVGYDTGALNKIAGLLEAINGYMPELAAAAGSSAEIYMDGKNLVGSVIHEIDRQLAWIQKIKEWG